MGIAEEKNGFIEIKIGTRDQYDKYSIGAK